jgi:hypothetical protein
MRRAPRLTIGARSPRIPPVKRALAGSVLLAALALVGCGSSSSEAASPGGGTPVAVGALVPDFSLLDVNPSSPTAGHLVSPRDYLKSVSAYYFTHTT